MISKFSVKKPYTVLVGADLAVVHAVYAHCSNHDRQHIRIQLHNDRVPDGIVPVTADLNSVLKSPIQCWWAWFWRSFWE